MMVVDVNENGTVSTPTELFDGSFVVSPPGGVRQYHVAPDERFLMLREGDASISAAETLTQVVLVENWLQELTERVPLP